MTTSASNHNHPKSTCSSDSLPQVTVSPLPQVTQTTDPPLFLPLYHPLKSSHEILTILLLCLSLATLFMFTGTPRFRQHPKNSPKWPWLPKEDSPSKFHKQQVLSLPRQASILGMVVKTQSTPGPLTSPASPPSPWPPSLYPAIQAGHTGPCTFSNMPTLHHLTPFQTGLSLHLKFLVPPKDYLWKLYLKSGFLFFCYLFTQRLFLLWIPLLWVWVSHDADDCVLHSCLIILGW